MTGHEIESALLNAISKQPNIQIFENHLAIDLITSQKLDYVEFFNPETLEPVTRVKPGTQMALAVFFGKTRLIDNARL